MQAGQFVHFDPCSSGRVILMLLSYLDAGVFRVLSLNCVGILPLILLPVRDDVCC